MEKLSEKIHPRKTYPVRVLQFGEGNFLRAFVDWIIDQMNHLDLFQSSVAVVQPLKEGRLQELTDQDGLYTLLLEGVRESREVSESTVIESLTVFNNPYKDYEGFLKLAELPELEFVISNTTEAGIALDKTDLMWSKTPNSFPGKVLALLRHRYHFFRGNLSKGLVFFPCELIDYNGTILRDTIISLAKLQNSDSNFIKWILKANYFCNTLVDRIVPGYPKNEAEQITRKLGYIDSNLVKAEPFHLWVIEGDESIKEKFPAHKTELQVKFVPDFRPYKERKVKILNGAHTAMVALGLTMGLETVSDCMENALLSAFIRKLLIDEVIGTISLPHDEMVSFTKEVFERFENPFICHELQSIALNSTTKFQTRILPSISDYYEIYGYLPKLAVFTLSALCVFFKNEQKRKIQDNPEYLAMWNSLWCEYTNSSDLVEKLLRHSEIFGDKISSIPNLPRAVSFCIDVILTKGMEEAMREVMK